MATTRDRLQNIVFTKQPFVEDVGPRRIKSMQFTVQSASEISKMAEVQVWKGQYYDHNRKPIEDGLLDPRMGPANKFTECATCHGRFSDCPGHYGYLKLAVPVYNVGFLSIILDILKCICKSCSRILLEDALRKDYLKKMRSSKQDPLKKRELMKKIVKKFIGKPVRCSKCGYMNGSVKKAVSNIGIIHDRSKLLGGLKDCRSAISHKNEASASIYVDSHVLNPARVFSLFKRMLDEDCELFYLSVRPENLIMTNIAVPPIAIRPSVIMDGSQSNENDLTERLKQIIRANAHLRANLAEGSSAAAFLDNWDELQVEVAQYINSDVRGIPPHIRQRHMQQNRKNLTGFIQRLSGKHGRFRGNLSGKRVEYTGRTVISPDPNMKVTEVAIPIQMARILTYPERVSAHNIEKLRQCVSNGPDKYPGARMLRRADGSTWSIRISRKRLADELKYGDIVERHIEDGDVVLFNRQPSLHRMSFMCHRARIMPWRTLRFNESVCNPYNADFDGDEMNLHVPQTEEARTEAILLMEVQNNLCTPKNGEILVASTQDFLTSSFLITRKDTFYDRAAFSLMCSYMGDAMEHIDLPTPAVLKPVELWTGKQLFSVFLRPNANVRVYLNLTVREKNYCKDLLVNGKEMETMCSKDGFVYFRNGELISGQLGKATLGNGNKDGLYSVLLRDYKAHAAAACMNRLAKLSARWIGDHGFSIGIDDVQPNEKLRGQINLIINEGAKECDGQIQLYNEGKLPPESGCDAAQSLEAKITQKLNDIREKTAKKLMKELHWRNSPLIMSQCGSKGSPINISQMVACVGQQSVGGHRAPNGFIDRSLPHFPGKDKTPAAKGFVAHSFYDGLSPTEFFFHTMGGREGLVDTAVKTADTGYMSRRLIKALEDLFVHYDNTVRNASGSIIQFCYGDDGMDPSQMEGKNGAPLNFERLFLKAKATCPAEGVEKLSPEKVSELVESRLSKHDMTPEGGCSAAFKTSLKNFLDEYVKSLKRTWETCDSTEDCVKKENFAIVKQIVQQISGATARQLEVFLDTCISRYHSKKIEPGTAIGAIGAQSIGEPGTQMTLKTFHFAGVASMNITLGVPRIKEIINGSKKISTPIVTAMLECDNNVNVARMVRGRMEKISLGQIAKSIKAVLTSRVASVFVTLDMDRIQDAQLSIDANVVQDAILRTPRIKLKQEHVRVLDFKKLEILPYKSDRSEILFNLNSLERMLLRIIVKGIKTVDRVVITKEGEKPETSKYKLFVEGTGLLAVMGTEGVDGRKTKSNHIIEVQQTLGIEAARACIIDEIEYTMNSHGMSIDKRHMMLLADVMTSRGEVLGITRFGIQKMDRSTLMLASFEKTADHLFNASVIGKEDRIEGVTESIIMGIPMQIGTGMLKVRQRVDVPRKLSYGPTPILSS